MQIDYIAVHCSLSPPGRGDDAETIHEWHKERTPPFDGIGYHFVILEDGSEEAGRPVYWPGAHSKPINDRSIGICLIGVDKFSLSQLAGLRILIDELLEEWPEAEVGGHRDFSENKRSCPNFDVKHWYATGEVRD